MDNDIKTWLFDILQSINEIDSYYEGKARRFDAYVADIKTKRAIERNLEIIGEAVNRIRKKDKNIQLENADKIIATRNRIIHGYDKIYDELLVRYFIRVVQHVKIPLNPTPVVGFIFLSAG
jgi:uncharacterized protein with HEPN domain